MKEDYIKNKLVQYLNLLRVSRKIQDFHIKENQIIISPYPRIAVDNLLYIDIKIDPKEEIVSMIDKIKTTIDVDLEKEINKRIFSSKFPTNEQIIKQSLETLQPTGRVLGKEESDGFVKGANWVLEFIKNSL